MLSQLKVEGFQLTALTARLSTAMLPPKFLYSFSHCTVAHCLLHGVLLTFVCLVASVEKLAKHSPA